MKKKKQKSQKKMTKSSSKKKISTPITKARKTDLPTRQRAQAGLIPLGDRVILKPLGTEGGTQLPSGIIIPETIDRERPEQARVVAVGPGRYENGKLTPLSVKVGDVVLFSKYGFDEIKYHGEEYYVLKEDNILAIIN